MPYGTVEKRSEYKMMNEDILMKAGVDYRKGVKRYLGDSEIYELLLLDFCADKQMQRSDDALKHGSRDELLEVAHEVKGTAANLDMLRLSEASSALVTALRDPASSDVQIEQLYGRYRQAFAEAKKAVKAAAE